MASDRIQCPNCGGYRTYGSRYFVDSTGARVKRPTNYRLLCLSLLVWLAGIGVAAAIGAESGWLAFAALVTGSILGSLMVISGSVQLDRRWRKMRAELSLRANCRCDLCGYDWISTDLNAKPVAANTYLIELAEEKRRRDLLN